MTKEQAQMTTMYAVRDGKGRYYQKHQHYPQWVSEAEAKKFNKLGTAKAICRRFKNSHDAEIVCYELIERYTIDV